MHKMTIQSKRGGRVMDVKVFTHSGSLVVETELGDVLAVLEISGGQLRVLAYPGDPEGKPVITNVTGALKRGQNGGSL